MKNKKKESKGVVIDLGEEITLNRWQIIQLLLICLALGAGLTMLNVLLGYMILGVAVLVLALPLINKVIGTKKE